jgi:2-iminobutanoate/2-iminopropanoate deaminase
MDTNQRKCIQTDRAPKPIGPYCQGNIAGPFVFTAAVGGLRPDGTLPEGIIPQTEQALKNIAAILEAGGCRLSDVAKVTVYLSNLENFRPMNEVYQRYFGQPYPARSIIQTGLPLGVVAFDAVALRPVVIPET